MIFRKDTQNFATRIEIQVKVTTDYFSVPRVITSW
jgi:hypothetical protein